jgi:hypothetical protein
LPDRVVQSKENKRKTWWKWALQDPDEPEISNVDVIATDNAGEMQSITTNNKRVNIAMVTIGFEEIDIVESICTLYVASWSGTDCGTDGPTTNTITKRVWE